jgi:hypothetical protein
MVLRELLSKMGKETDGMTCRNDVRGGINKSASHPLSVLDEADKLADAVLLFLSHYTTNLKDTVESLLWQLNT